jgi:hypothetical protein
MTRPVLRHLIVICVLALAVRVALLALFVRFPGIADPNHYYNLGVRLVQGDGYTIPYIWQYNDDYADVVHPDDYWMPVTALIAAGGMRVFGISTTGALIPFIVLGSLLPLIGFAAARQFGLRDATCLWVGAAAALIPELVLNSVRTDTTIPNALCIGLGVIAFTHGVRTGRLFAFAAAGIGVGLAYNIRSESLLFALALVFTLASYALWSRHETAWRRVLIGTALMLGMTAACALPWTLRNVALNGTFSTPTTSNMFFLTDYRDHYVFERALTLQTYLDAWTPGQIIGKRLFELAATAKLMVTTLDALPLLVIGGGLLVVAARDTRRGSALAPVVLALIGFIVFYPILVPFKSQGGSMKKAYLSLIPLLIPVAGYALERAITDARIRAGAMSLVVLLLGANAFELVRQDATFTATYRAQITAMSQIARTLPDVTGDGRVIFMTQDPFMLGYEGLSSVMYPFPDRAAVDAVIARYGVDYLLMPPDRPALDAIYERESDDMRLTFVAGVPRTDYEFWRVEQTP